MAQQSGNNGRTGRTQTPSAPSAPEVPTVLAVTLPSEDEWEDSHVNVLDVADLPDNVVLIAVNSTDLYFSKSGKRVLQASVSFLPLDSKRELSVNLVRKPTQADRKNDDLINPNVSE